MKIKTQFNKELFLLGVMLVGAVNLVLVGFEISSLREKLKALLETNFLQANTIVASNFSVGNVVSTRADLSSLAQRENWIEASFLDAFGEEVWKYTRDGGNSAKSYSMNDSLSDILEIIFTRKNVMLGESREFHSKGGDPSGQISILIPIDSVVRETVFNLGKNVIISVILLTLFLCAAIL